MSDTATSLPQTMIDLVNRVVRTAEQLGWRRRGRSATGLQAAQVDLGAAVADLIAALDVPPAWRDVAAERRRQIDAEGWTPGHDDHHVEGELARAGSAYAYAAAYTEAERATGGYPTWWPFSRSWWKLADRRRMLVKAAALILAEIERLDRAAARVAAPSAPTPLPPQAAAAIAAARAAD